MLGIESIFMWVGIACISIGLGFWVSVKPDRVRLIWWILLYFITVTLLYFIIEGFKYLVKIG